MDTNKFSNVWAAQLLIAYLENTGRVEAVSPRHLESLKEFAAGREGDAEVRRGACLFIDVAADGFTCNISFNPAEWSDFFDDQNNGDLVEVRAGAAKLNYSSPTIRNAEEANKFADFTRWLAGAVEAMKPATTTKTTVVETGAQRAERRAVQAAKEKATALDKIVRARVDAARKNMRVGASRSIDLTGIEGLESCVSARMQFADYGGKVVRTYDLIVGTHELGVLVRKS